MRMHGGDEAFLNKSFKLDDPEWDRLSDLSASRADIFCQWYETDMRTALRDVCRPFRRKEVPPIRKAG